MTRVFITIDTEYEPGFTARHGKDTQTSNFAQSIACTTPGGDVGVAWQARQFARRGLKAVFFVDPMPALLWGTEAISQIVTPILEHGHDVQLHIHTEWLALAGDANPLGGRTGANIRDFALEDQHALIDYAIKELEAAGAPRPVAFRAGNYGANDDTLRALANLGLTHDTSHSPGLPGSACEIGLGAQDRQPLTYCGVTEVPIGCIGDIGGKLRHAQITALSLQELTAAIRHARDTGAESFTIVSHSFELLSRDRARINTVVRNRFERLCEFLASEQGVSTGTYAGAAPAPVDTPDLLPVLKANVLRTGLRHAEQAVSNLRFGGN